MSAGDYPVPAGITVSGNSPYQVPQCPHCHQPMPSAGPFTVATGVPISTSIEALERMLASMTEAEREEWRRRSTVCGGAFPAHGGVIGGALHFGSTRDAGAP